MITERHGDLNRSSELLMALAKIGGVSTPHPLLWHAPKHRVRCGMHKISKLVVRNVLNLNVYPIVTIAQSMHGST